MRRYTYFLFLALVCSSLCGCHFFWKKYKDTKYGFSMQIPRFWTVDTSDKSVAAIIFAPLQGKKDNFRENVTIASADLVVQDIVEVFWENNKKALMLMIPGYKSKIEEGEFFSGVNKGQYLSFETKGTDLNLKIKTVAWFRGTTVYSATCSAQVKDFPKYEKTFDKMLRSLRFNPPPSANAANPPKTISSLEVN